METALIYSPRIVQFLSWPFPKRSKLSAVRFPCLKHVLPEAYSPTSFRSPQHWGKSSTVGAGPGRVPGLSAGNASLCRSEHAPVVSIARAPESRETLVSGIV
jgi:hypothetical protein